MLIPMNLTGGTYKHKSYPVSAQVTRNFWPQLQQDDSTKSSYILESFPGQKPFATTIGSHDRGMFEHKDTLYKITGTTLYSVSNLGVSTVLGTIPGVFRCVIVGISSSIVIVTGGRVFYWNGTILNEVLDSDLETPNAAAHLDGHIIYDGDDGRFGSSQVGDPSDIDGLDYATAETDADELLRPYVFEKILYLMGAKTIEPWFSSGQGNPPFDPYQGGAMPFGLGAIHSVAHSDKAMYLLDDENQVQAIKGQTGQVISPQVLTAEFSRYPRVDDALGWCMNILGQVFYCLTFPTGDKTWLFPEGGEPFEWSSGSSGGRSVANSYAYAFRKHLIADYRNGNIYELDAETYTNNGETIVRTRDTGPIHGGLLQKPGKRLEMNRFELIMEVGVGLTTGQGDDPVVMLSFSDDGGKTFQEEIWGTIGKIGQYMWKVEWFALGSFDTRVMRIRISDPVHCSIHSAAADIEVCI